MTRCAPTSTPSISILSWQSSIPALLVNQHSIANEAQAEAYVARIAGLGAIADAKTDVRTARAPRMARSRPNGSSR